ncbi:MAG: hypothetical protein KGS48_18035 [Bacteroidetes bacterium]|nr:hypothetical protein [Bacteroidota bacterium]
MQFKQIIKFSILALLILFFAQHLEAQCAMCKASSETNLRQGGGDPNGLNAGILYMLSLPYLIVGGIAFWWWRNRKQE